MEHGMYEAGYKQRSITEHGMYEAGYKQRSITEHGMYETDYKQGTSIARSHSLKHVGVLSS